MLSGVMEKPRRWTYTELRERTHEIAEVYHERFRGLPLLERGLDRLESIALRIIDIAAQIERLTYPSRWERIANDSMIPPE